MVYQATNSDALNRVPYDGRPLLQAPAQFLPGQ